MNEELEIHEFENHVWVDDALAFEKVDDDQLKQVTLDDDHNDELDASKGFKENDDEGEEPEN